MTRRNKIALWSLIIVVILTTISLQWVRPIYRGTKMWYFIHMAENLVKKKDYSAASLAYRKALLSGADRPDAWKSLAKFLEQVDSPEIIGVWEKLGAIEPNVREHRYKQAAAAIKYGRNFEAEAILDKVPASWREDSDYLRSVAIIAIQKNQLAKVEHALNGLLKKNPKDEEALYDLALARTKSSDSGTRIQAKEDLADIGRSDSKFASTALRQLVDVAMQEKDLNEADRLATKLIAMPNATVRDRFTHLQLELQSQSLTAQISINNLHEYAQKYSENFETVVDWLLSNNIDPAGTAAWLKGLPPEFARKVEVQSGFLHFFLSVSDFKEVFRILRERRESLNIPANVLDLAEKAINQVDVDPGQAGRTWLEAVYAAEGNPQALYYLSIVSSSRGWMSATGRALSALADGVPGQAGVWNLLAKHESSAGNLPGYYKALGGLMRINPYDIHVASDWVIASVLLRKGQADEILDVSKRTYDATEPADPWAGTAYAMALLQAERPKQALEIMNRMSESNRMLPQRAIYMGAILAGSGQKAEALEFFARSESFKETKFPEEIALRRVWKGVALGEASTAEESKRLLATRKDLRAESHRIEMDLRAQLRQRSNQAEVQQIFNELKAKTQQSQQTPPEVQQFIQEIRSSESKQKPSTYKP
jgi:tetratricopeptide (TPR) repeat protein